MKTSKRTITFRSLTTLLAIVMALMSLPLGVFASSIPQATEETPTVTDAAMPEVYEVVERREESVKHFRLADGSYVAAQYESAVHELDEDGNWQDIDNTLTDTLTGYESGSGKVKFANNSTSSKILSIKNGDYQISFGLVDAAKSHIEVLQNGTEVEEGLSGYEALAALTKLVSKVRYADVYENADLEYVLSGNNIKENIVLKAGGLDSYSYSFEMKLKGLSATLVADGSVILADEETGVTVYTIPAPYMYDAAGEYSGAVQYALTQKNSKYTLTVTADADWINSEGRAFPVTVDPTIGTGTSQVNVYISSASPSSSFSGNTTYAGIDASGNNYISLNKITQFTSLPENVVITEAHMIFSGLYAGTGDFPLYLSRVTTNWDDTVTYNDYTDGSLSISGTVTDYVWAPGATTYSFDITTLLQGWIDQSIPNYGVAIYAPSGTANSCRASLYISSTTTIPHLEVTYRDTKGLEDYYSYRAASADGAGTGYVNLFNGQLTFLHDSLSTTDSLMPYTFGLTYNGAWAGATFGSDTGYGFKLYTDEIIQRITLPTAGTTGTQTYYVWSDGDGTEHYFSEQTYLKGNVSVSGYCDEDGLKLYLSEDNGCFTITDDVGNVKHFNANGKMDYIQDANGNRRNFEYDNNKLVRITLTPNNYGSTIHQLKFTYNSNGKMGTAINEQTGLSAAFAYANGLLMQITYTYSSGSTYTVKYEYDSNNRLVAAKDLKTGQAVGFTYSTAGAVTKITEYGNTTNTSLGVAGQSVGITYAQGRTICRTSGKNDVYGDTDDVSTIYNFDSTGKVASAYTTDNSLTVYGSSSYTYSSENLVKTENSLTSVMSVGGMSANLLKNPGLDGTVNGKPSGWQTYGNVFIPNISGTENKCVRMTIPHTTSSSATYTTATLKQSFSVIAGTYSLSAYINVANLSNTAHVRLVVYNNSETVVAASPYLESHSINAYSTRFEKLSLTFDVTSDCSTASWYVGVELAFKEGAATTASSIIDVDSIMLEKFNAAGAYSSLSDGGFENTVSGWTKSYGTISTTGWLGAGSKEMKLTGSPTSRAYAKNVITLDTSFMDDIEEVEMTEPLVYVLSGFAMASSVPTAYPAHNQDNTAQTPTFALKAVINYYNTSFKSIYYIPFNDNVSTVQFVSGAIASEPDENGYCHHVTSIEIYCCYEYNANIAYFDNISLIKDSNCITTYTYNSMGYATGSATSDGNSSAYTYGSNQVDVTGITTDIGSEYGIQYDNKHRVTSFVDSNGSGNYRVSYTYDGYGNVVATNTQDLAANGKSMLTGSTYATDATNANYFGALLTETDENGGTARYFYNSKGQLAGVCDALGNGIIYEYDAYGNLNYAIQAVYSTSSSSLQREVQQIKYEYNEDLTLNSAESDMTFRAGFDYDAYDNLTRISVGNCSITYVYNANNGKLNKQTYSNGDSVSYRYDAVDRVIAICYNGSTTATYSYTYNANGRVAEHTDLKSGLQYHYAYDTSGRLVEVTARKQSTNALQYTQKTNYDAYGRISAIYNYYFNAAVDPLVYTEYTYDAAGNIYSITYGGIGKAYYYSYDAFGRLSVKLLADSDSPNSDQRIYQSYTYKANSSNDTQTTHLVDAVTTATLSETTKAQYQYDGAGNITEIKIIRDDGTTDGVLEARYNYAYDNQYQLVREDIQICNNSTASCTILYDYEAEGPWYITRYNYSAPGTTPTGYRSSTVMEDELYAESVSFDAMGNLATYKGLTFNWNGRQLEGASGYTDEDEDLTTTYTYNADGIRTSKTVEGIVYNYTVEGTQILRETQGYSSGKLLRENRYYYDAEGNPCAIRSITYNYTTGAVTGDVVYYLQTNLQGDVVAIYSEAGVKLYSYVYDAWGNLILGTEHADGGDEAAAVNPFLYRGYYYDAEIGMYYLNSRYYKPDWCLFISPDDPNVTLATPEGLTDKKPYVYCDNNPVMRTDDGGEFWNIVAGAVVGGVVNLVSSVVAEILDPEPMNAKSWAQLGVSVGIGMVEGALSALCPGATALISSLSAVAETAINGAIEGKDGVMDIAIDSVYAGVFGAIAGSGGSDFVKGGMMNDAAKAAKNILTEGIHPAVKKGARKTLRQAGKEIGGSLSTGLFESFAYGGISDLSSWATRNMFDIWRN